MKPVTSNYTCAHRRIRNCRSQQLENTETDTFAYVQKQHQPISFILSFLKPFNPSTADNINIVACYNKDKYREDRVINIIRSWYLLI